MKASDIVNDLIGVIDCAWSDFDEDFQKYVKTEWTKIIKEVIAVAKVKTK